MNKMKFGTTEQASAQTDLEILYPYDMTRNSNDIENVFTTEDGHDHIISTRKDKQSVAMVFHCSSGWVKKFKQYYIKPEFWFEEYDSITNASQRRHVRMKNYSEHLVKNSWKVDSTTSQGLWEVSFTLEEL